MTIEVPLQNRHTSTRCTVHRTCNNESQVSNTITYIALRQFDDKDLRLSKNNKKITDKLVTVKYYSYYNDDDKDKAFLSSHETVKVVAKVLLAFPKIQE